MPIVTDRRHQTGLALLALIVGGGCQVGPVALQIGQAEYNEAIQHSSARQMLLNLVRLKYRELPLVLDISSISSQFEIASAAGVSGRLNENVGQGARGISSSAGFDPDGPTGGLGTSGSRVTGSNPDWLDLSASFSYTERPTITYSPLHGGDYVQRMLSPIGVETVVTLCNTGWRIDRVLNLTVQDMNGLDNLGSASGPTPTLAPDCKAFRAALRQMRKLQVLRAISLEFESIPDDLASPIEKDRITAEDLLTAAAANAKFRPIDNGERFVLSRDRKRAILRLSDAPEHAEQVAALRDQLELAADQFVYELVPARTQTAGYIPEKGPKTRIVLDTRSLGGVLFFLSECTIPPDSHVEAGLITQTVDRDGQPFDWGSVMNELMVIHTSRWPSKDAYVSVRKRGHWFYIRDDDLNSKSTFMLLGQIFRLQAGEAKSTAPVLTLPIGG